MGEKLTNQQVLEADLPGWRPLASRLHARFATDDFATGLALVDAIGAAAEKAGHHPDLELRWGRVDVRLSSHDVGGITQRDLDLARRITELATESGVRSEPECAQMLELALDAADHQRIKPFWRAVLGYVDRPGADDEIVDPQGTDVLWFQETDEHERPRQRFHIDLWVPVDVAGDRIEAALAAGGTLVSDEAAPSFTVLADADGNNVCVCTNAERT